MIVFFFFRAEDGIRDRNVTGVQTCALPIFRPLADKCVSQRSLFELASSSTADSRRDMCRSKQGSPRSPLLESPATAQSSPLAAIEAELPGQIGRASCRQDRSDEGRVVAGVV